MKNTKARAIATSFVGAFMFSSTALAQPDAGAGAEDQAGSVGALYAMTNEADGNAVVQYTRNVRGALELASITSTGGLGIGTSNVIPGITQPGVDPLISAHSLTLHKSKKFLFACNSGDGTVSVFKLGASEPELTDRVSVGNMHPSSIASFEDLIYISSAGDPGAGIAPQLAGFRLSSLGKLVAIPGGSVVLGDAGQSLPTHTLFSPDGSRVIVSDLLANQIIVFPLAPDGSLGTPRRNPSAGQNPFGMTLTSSGILVVSEAAGAAPGASTVSSYRLSDTSVVPISAAVPNGQTAACWLSATPDGRFVYASNTGSGNVSIYSLSVRGALTLVQGNAVPRAPATPGGMSGPVDSAISRNGRYFYQQYSGLGEIGAFEVLTDGSLAPIPGGDGTGLPALGSEGLDGF